MNVLVEGLLYLGGGFLRLLDLLTDVWYLTSQDFTVLQYLNCRHVHSFSAMVVTTTTISKLKKTSALYVQSRKKWTMMGKIPQHSCGLS